VSTIAELATLARANQLAQQYYAQNNANITANANKKPTTKSSDEAALPTITVNQFSNEVEKHIADYRRGQAGLSKQTAGKLRYVDQQNAELLQNISPKALSDYGAYGSFLSYEKHSRYVSNVYAAAKGIADLKRTLESA
jgi:hypothetical protein